MGYFEILSRLASTMANPIATNQSRTGCFSESSTGCFLGNEDERDAEKFCIPSWSRWRRLGIKPIAISVPPANKRIVNSLGCIV